MIIDGKQIQYELKNMLSEQVRAHGKRITLAVIITHETLAIRKFVELKQRFGHDIGVAVEPIVLGTMDMKTEKLLQLLLHTTRTADGIVLQLPLYPELELAPILKLFPLSHDVDVLGETGFQQFKERKLPFKPPVVAAFEEVLARTHVMLSGKKVLVVGEGHLVGEPAAIWAEHLGARVTTVNAATPDIGVHSADADVIISGAGSPGLIQPNMIKDGVVLLDAGTSEVEGVLAGDIDPACAEKALIYTPTPGGIGPITIAKLFENLMTLVRLKAHQAR